MASSNSLSSRLEELRSRNPQSPPGEITYSGYNTPNRYSGSFMPSHSQASASDARASLQRRFTADSGNVPTITPIGQQPSQIIESVDMAATTLYKVQALEKKKLEYEKLREQRRRFEAELEKFNRQQALEEKEIHRMANDIQGLNLSTGHQSEPTTPPEYRDHVYPSIYSRRNRYSSSSLVSPPGINGINNRLSRSGSQLISPQADSAQAQAAGDVDKLPSKSVPGSRRGSTDRISSYLLESSVSSSLSTQRSTTKSNRYSMPATSARKRDSVSDYTSVIGMGPINTTGFLFGDDDEKPSITQKESTTSPDVKSYLQMNTTDDKFPILIRNNHQPGLLSASSAALDLALSQSPGPGSQTNGWPTFARHRPSQQSLPQNVFEAQQPSQQNVTTPSSSSQQSYEAAPESPTSIRQVNRRSMEASFASHTQKNVLNQNLTNGASGTRPSLANLQSSFSTNDIPTLKNNNNNQLVSAIAPPRASAQQQFHNHNASLGRIPPSALSNRQSREITIGDARRDESINGYKPLQSELQASAAPFGPSMSASTASELNAGPVSPSAVPQYPGAAYYGGYGMQLMNMGMSPMQMGGQMGYPNHVSLYQAQNQYSPYAQYGQPQARFPDSQARIIQQRRLQNVEDVARFTNTKIESYLGEIYTLSKDQHGCRYLQKQLEGREPSTIHLIFSETNQHVVELMTDPFGNYLCQKLLEYSNDDQRTILINNAAPQMVKIALNQHGTRALQKMIEFISTPEQIQTIIHALKDRVVELIQDLNGNHVIQKCLNRLSPEDAQFIFDAVGTNCVVVGTHRHGCCVLQRCIDHASGYQKANLIGQITENAFALVQDPFGNYVLQYIVDLAEPVFTNPLCYSFQTNIPLLSKQKFSSNVIEKCIRGAEPHVTTMMIEEMLNANELEKMLRDSFANYVVQTALDYADAETRNRLVEAIRPILPAIRQTPYGRRIQSKILGVESPSHPSGVSTPHDMSSPGQIPLGRQTSTAPGPFGSQTAAVPHYQNGFYSNSNRNTYGANGVAGNAQYSSINPGNSTGHGAHLSNGSSAFSHFSSSTNQSSVPQPVPLYGRVGQNNAFNYF